ncbi:hypothetical protein [Bacillus toyonensis]|uniref:hypothetical protein n=1 Tax=Bacillus toyonensis TaxID=155322 RepID=UPI000BF32C65|nr:hypothetical protein [Bacillus toyonensis]PGF05339.1 hypothetical protein COM61_02710 [Bacillus toyonensis]
MLKLETSHIIENGEVKFYVAQLKDGEKELFQTGDLTVYQSFLRKLGIELRTPVKSEVGNILIQNTYHLDQTIALRPFTNKDEVPLRAEYVITVVDSIVTEGAVSIKEDIITIWYPALELGTEELKRLAFELFKKRNSDISRVPVFLIDYMVDNQYYKSESEGK